MPFTSLPPALFVRTQLKEPRITTLAVKFIGGSSGTDGVLLAAEGSTISAVADLKGKTLCVPDLESTTGALFPRLAMQKAGLDWSKDVTVVLSGNHLQVLRDLLAHKCEAGGTYSGVFASAVTQGVDVSVLRQVAVTGRSPQDAVVAGPGVPKAEADAAATGAALVQAADRRGRQQHDRAHHGVRARAAGGLRRAARGDRRRSRALSEPVSPPLPGRGSGRGLGVVF